MARKKTRSLAGKKFFSLVVLSVSALGLLFTANYALQQQTSTESEAAYTKCNIKPKFTYDGAKSNANNVIYKFTTKNINSKSCAKYKKQAYVIEVINPPSKKWRFKDSRKISYYPHNSWESQPYRESKIWGTTYDKNQTLKYLWYSWTGNSTQNNYTRTRKHNIQAIPPSGAKKGKYSFKVQICQINPKSGFDKNLQFNGYRIIRSNCNVKTMTYYKD